MKQVNDLNNKYRVLLTEVLPYELPLVLNNESFYENLQDDNLRNLFVGVFNNIITNKERWTIPFDYNVRRVGGEKSRKLSLMHPFTQLDCVNHYEKYDEYMLNLCSHSPFSIRYISKKAKCVFPPEEDSDGENEDLPEEATGQVIEMDNNSIEKHYRSYFSYKKYDLAYKFFESGDSLRLEQKFSHMMTLDITGCFYHIYTHTIAWAVKGKEIAKESINSETFEKNFDQLMQHANYNETNGIVVGPEISRIFAEIILQAVDLAILRQLKEKGHSLGRDYEIRRYVDDSYVYANSRKVLDDICTVYKEQLAFYKLDINEKKRECFERPFTSGVSDAKRQVNKMVAEFKEKHLKRRETEGEEKHYASAVRSDYRLFMSFVKHFRSITHQFQQHYGDLNKYTLTLLLNQIRREMRKEMVPSQNLLTGYADIAFFLFSLDMHTTASYRLCSILDCLVRWSDTTVELEAKQELTARIRREAKRVIDIYQGDFVLENTNLEVLNLLITLHRLIGFKIPTSQIDSLFGLTITNGDGYERLNYFQLCTLLYLIENDGEYSAVLNGIETELLLRLSEPKSLRKADNACLFFDVMTCPYIDKATCLKIIEQCLCISNRGQAGNKRAALAKPKRWFFDWDKTHNLTEYLEKKEYHSPYE